MITTVTPNPCIDKTLSVSGFSLDRTNRADVLRTEIGGKGINVSRAFHALGGLNFSVGIDFGADSPLSDALSREELAHGFVCAPGALRVCTKIFDPETKKMIEINERGCAVDGRVRAALLESVVRAARGCDTLVLSGSLPEGLGVDFYATCLAAVHESAPRCRVIVDADGESLTLALRQHPFLIKPNEKEFANTFGVAAELSSIDKKAAELIGDDVLDMICVSLGERGAYLADATGACFCPPARVEVLSLQAAGDSMVAGICLALEKGRPLADILAFGTAAAGATVSHVGTEVGTYAEFKALLPTLTPERIR